MCDEDYSDEQRRRDNDAEEAERRKEEVGMAEPGTDEYNQNAAYILRSYTEPNEETREKLRWLSEHRY